MVGDAFQEFEVPAHCYASNDADVAIFMARSTGLSLSGEDKRRFEGAPLCLRRAEWNRWLASSAEAGRLDSASMTVKAAAEAWLPAEMARRMKTKERRTGPVMVRALRDEFPSLQERVARRIFIELRMPSRPSAEDGRALEIRDRNSRHGVELNVLNIAMSK
jgi:hypothetical protein